MVFIWFVEVEGLLLTWGVSDTIRVEVLICQRWSFMALKNSLFLWSCVWLEGIVVQGLYIKVWYICSVICISEASTSYIKG
jgi:hypothetical protein